MENRGNKNVPNEYSLKIARSVEEVEELRPIWEKIQWHPNSDIDFYLTIVNSRREIIRPHVIVVSIQEIPKSILVGRIEDQRIDIKIGYKTIFSPQMRILRVVYGGMLGERSDCTNRIFISELMKELRKGEIGALFLDNLQVNSTIFQLAKREPSLLCRDHANATAPHWKMFTPDKIDKFYQKLNSKHRYWLRRMAKLLEKDFYNRVKVRIFRERDQILQLCNDVEDIAKKTYQRGIGAGFINNVENQRRMALSADRGWLRAYVMYIDEKPCAFWVGTQYKETFHLDFTGYDPPYKAYELGTILFTKMIEDLCKSSNSIREIDFGFGDAFYKQRFGDEKWEEATVCIFAPTFKGVGINLTRGVFTAISQWMTVVLRKTNFLQKTKRIWRNRLSQKISSDNENS